MRQSKAGWRYFFAFAVLTVGGPVVATPPSVSFTPPPDSQYASSEDCQSAASLQPPFELDFAAGGNCTTGAPCQIGAVPTGGSGNTIGDQTILFCSEATLSGDGAVVATLMPENAVIFTGSNAGSATLEVTCTPGTQDTIARACCTENRAGDQFHSLWDVRCPAPASAKPEFASTPAAGFTFNLSAAPGGNMSANLRVDNTGPGALQLTAGGVSDPVTVAPSTPQTITSGNHLDFTITCAPTEVGTQVQVLTLDTNDEDEGAVDYSVSCTGTAPPAPEIEPTPAPGPIAIGTTQPANGTAPLTIANVGNATLTVSSLTGLTAPLSVAPPNASIPGGGSTPFTITCNGASAGSYSGTLIVASNDADEPSLEYFVTCDVLAPELTTLPDAPGPLTLAATQGAPPATTTLAVFNSGTATLDVNSATGLSPPLSVSPPSLSVGPGQSQDFTISCATGGNGSFEQQLTLATNDADEGLVGFAVSCGVNPPATPEYASTPTAPGPLAISTTQGVNGSATLTVQNVGTGTLTIGSITGLAAPFSISPPSASIAPGTSQAFTLTCSGANVGTFNNGGAPMVVNSNDASEASVNYTVSCNVGAAVVPEYTSTPPAPGPLGIVTTQGTSATVSLSVQNDGTGPLVISSITGATAPISVSPGSATIAVNTKMNFFFTCDAANIGTFSRSVTVNTNDASEPAVVYTVNCTVNQRPSVFGSTPNPGSAINLSTSVGIISTTSLIVRNNAAAGAKGLTLTTSGLSSPLSIGPTSIGGSGVPPGGNQTLTVRCAPTSAGTTFQTLRLTTNAPNAPSPIYPVTCVSKAPEFNSVPKANSTITINAQRGATNATVSLKVENLSTDDGDLRVVQSGLSGRLSLTPTNPQTINPPFGALIFSVTYKISCDASTVGSTTQTLTLAHNDVGESPAKYTIVCNVAQTTQVKRGVSALLSTDVFVDVLFADDFETIQ